MSWKYCFVLSCLNNSKNNPEKYYFRVPYNKDLREKWCTAVDRPALSLKPSSPAYCCSDHFNMVEDLDPSKSTSTSPKLQKGVMPSKYSNNSSYSGEKMAEIEDIFGSDVLGQETTDLTESDEEGRYVREVVYIEENDNDQFLQENVEESDGLSIARIDEPENETKAVVEISDDDNLLNAVATAIKSLKPTENVLKVKKSLKMNTSNNESNSFVNQIVDSPEHQMKVQEEVVALKTQAVVKNKTVTTNSLKAIEGKMVTPRPVVQVLGKIKASTPVHKIIRKVVHPLQEQIPVQRKMIASIPPSKNFVLNSKTKETCNALVPINTPLKFHTRTVAILPPNTTSSSRYQTTNSATSRPVVTTKTSQQQPMISGIEKKPLYQVNHADQQNELPIKRYKQSVDDDDDCILLEEPAPKCNSNANEVQNKLSLVSSVKSNVLSGLLIKKLPACISVKPNAVPQIPNMQLTTSESNTTISRIVRVEPTTSIRELGKSPTSTLRITNKIPDQELQLIKLILLENPSICKSSPSNTVKIIRSKKNQFQIADNIYYYRTNYQFPKNYFFMNITRNTCQSLETIQRNYGIYWGRPRISCVGIVETRGILDDETKDFVFIQVKKSLFEQNGQQNLKFLNVIQQSVPKPVIPFSRSKPVMIQSIVRESESNSLQPSNADPEIINLDDDDEIEIVPKTKTNPLVNFLTNVKIPSINSPLLTQKTTRISSNEIPPNQIVQQSLAKDLDMSDAVEIQKNGSKGKKDGLVQFYKRLTPSMRKLINKLKYFEVSNGAVYGVTIGPNYSSQVANENACNIVFQKNSPDSHIQPVSRHLSVSMLVNDIFDAIHTNIFDYSFGHSENVECEIGDSFGHSEYVECEIGGMETNNLGPSKKHDKLMVISSEMKNPTLIHSAPADNIIPIGEPIKRTIRADNIIPVGEPIKIATTATKIKSPSTAVKRPYKKTIQPKSTNPFPFEKYFKKVSSPIKNKSVVVSANNENKAYKYKCDVCAQGFDRAYKFRRHQFVHHSLDKVDGNLIPIDEVSNTVSEPTVEKVKETVVQKQIPSPEQLFTSHVESKLIIKQEKLDITVPNETVIPNDKYLPDDKTLLIPLFEIPMQEQSDHSYLNDFLSVNVKQEPEEHFEELVVMPLPPVNYPSLKKTVQKKPKQINPKPKLNLEKNTDSSTDSATEVAPFFEKNKNQKRKMKTRKLPKKRVQNVCKAVGKINRRRKTKKRLKKVTKNVKIRNGRNNLVVPVKISKVKQLMMNLPKCYVNLTDIIKQS